jgi:outer membrane protein assembly factor BamC
LLAGSLEAESKAGIVRTNDGETLLLRIDFDRAWSQVGQALNNAEIEETESSRDEAYYSVLYTGVSEEDEPGFFGRLFGRGDNNDGVTPAFTIRLITTEGLVTVIAVQTAGAADNGELRDQLIRAINNNLI